MLRNRETRGGQAFSQPDEVMARRSAAEAVQEGLDSELGGLLGGEAGPVVEAVNRRELGVSQRSPLQARRPSEGTQVHPTRRTSRARVGLCHCAGKAIGEQSRDPRSGRRSSPTRRAAHLRCNSLGGHGGGPAQTISRSEDGRLAWEAG
jgi:hypothetical protein